MQKLNGKEIKSYEYLTESVLTKQINIKTSKNQTKKQLKYCLH